MLSSARAIWQRLRVSASRPRLRIVVRQSPDWRNTPHAELLEGSRAFCRTVAAATGFAENFISDVVGVWDATFALPFFQVRAAMKDIAQQNLRAVRSATLVPLASAHFGSAAQPLHLFIDDDDWLRPDICSALQPHLNDADGYIFGNILCVSHIELRRLEDGCYTNNYAVAAAYLAKFEGRCEQVAQHWDANGAFHQPEFRRTYVPLYLSATNKHPASAMKLKDGLQHDELSSRTLRRLVEKFVDESAHAQTPAQAAWVLPHVRQVRDVFAGLL